MLKIENYEVVGWEHVIRGMRNPKNSWDKSDSRWNGWDSLSFIPDHTPVIFDEDNEQAFYIGPNDRKLMSSLAKGGPVHAKYRRMITVYLDITAPLYWWKEFDTYKVGTVANSCSTMHKIHDKEFTMDDFSYEHLLNDTDEAEDIECFGRLTSQALLWLIVQVLNFFRKKFIKTNDKRYWWQMIQLLPTSYNQKRTVMLNYEVLHNIYFSRKDHKLDEWHTLCDWIKTLPYSELITMEAEN